MKFLPLALGTLMLFLALLGAASAKSANTYENRVVGIHFDKPADWHFLSATRNRENLENMKMNSEQLKKAILKYASKPLVILTKHAEPFNDLNLSLKISVKPLGRLKGVDPKRLLGLFLPRFKQMFKDFRLMQKPRDTKLSDLKAAYMRLNYTAVTKSGLTFPTTSEMWLVLRANHFFLIGAGSRQDEKTGSRAEIRKIVNSIRIRK
ncbi:MAG: hypothetical protein L3J67_06825 [Hyphomicrobiaceae bacterium]|nr:hypothetical protein [Hyphomicrobiaceae bacterium]